MAFGTRTGYNPTVIRGREVRPSYCQYRYSLVRAPPKRGAHHCGAAGCGCVLARIAEGVSIMFKYRRERQPLDIILADMYVTSSRR